MSREAAKRYRLSTARRSGSQDALRRRPVFETLEARAAPGGSFLGFLGLAFMSGALDSILGARKRRAGGLFQRCLGFPVHAWDGWHLDPLSSGLLTPLNLWKSEGGNDANKTPLTNSEDVPPGSFHEWYSWTIGGENPPSSPIQIGAEGDTLAGADSAAEHVYWRLVKPGATPYNDGDIIERDTVKINVEKIVWPLLQQKYGN